MEPTPIGVDIFPWILKSRGEENMKIRRHLAWLLALLLAVAMLPCAGAEELYGPIYDEWSEMTEEELYAMAQEEGGEITVYATSSKMLKAEETFEELYPGLDLVIYDLDQDEVLSKCEIEA